MSSTASTTRTRARIGRRSRAVALAAATMLALAACGDDAGDADAPPDDGTADEVSDEDAGDGEPVAEGEPIRVGIVTSTSGLLSSYGNAYLDGLDAGIDYATDGSGAVNGRPIELEVVDDGGEPDQAISAAVDLVGQGITILAGSASSGVAVQMAPFAEENEVLFISGPAATSW